MRISLKFTPLGVLALVLLTGSSLTWEIPAGASGVTARLVSGATQLATGTSPLLKSVAPPQIWSTIPACSQFVRPGVAHCDAIVRTDATARAARPLGGIAAPSGTFADNGAYSPAYLQSAYNVAALDSAHKGGAGQIVAIVDAYDDPNLASDLAYYRNYFGLTPCPSGVVSSASSGCVLQQVNENGAAAPLPAANGSWAIEEAIDVEMVSAICPNCQLLLVEASSASISDLGTGVNTAVSMGATVVSNSYGSSEYPSENADAQAYYNHPGVPIVVASGDSGFGVNFPAAAPTVVAVGGTSLIQNSATGVRDGSESAWIGAGAGCSAYEPKPAWQHDTGCANRSVADVSAVADPSTGVWMYDTYGRSGLAIAGGTSVAAPIISAIFALSGGGGGVNYPASNLYAHPGALYPVTTGNDGTCGTYLCDATMNQGGYAGPTGLGTPGASPSSLAAFAAPDSLSAAPTLTAATAGNGLVDLAWSAPGAGAYAITGYNVYQWTSTGVLSSPLNGQPLTSTSYTVTPLANGTTYGFVVTALNAVGESVPSNILSATPAQLNTVAGSPTNVVATVVNREAHVRWTAPLNDGGAPITYYTVSDNAGRTCIDQVSLTGSNSCLINGLVAGSSYSFRVSALNQIGESAPSAPSNSIIVTARVTLVGTASLVAFTSHSSALSVQGQTVLTNLARHLTKNALINLTGYAQHSTALALQRDRTVARFLARLVHVRSSWHVVTTARLRIVKISVPAVAH